MPIGKQDWLKEEGAVFPGRTYAEVVLAPAFDQAKAELLLPMMTVNRAHLIMLREQGLVSDSDAERIAAALESLDLAALQQSAYTGQFEDLFFQVEHGLLEHAGDAAGNLHLARSRNDMGIAIYRLVLREKLLETIGSALLLHERLLSFAGEHTETVMLGYTHTQQAQPTTMAHYIAAVSDSLGRDLRRLKAAFANCNRSSMGAAALTTSGFAVSRERMAELLAFDGLIDNAYDAVSGADYVGEIAAAVQLAAINLGRFVQELLLWSTQEFAVLHVAPPYVQISSIMPQKRNPVSIEHMRSLLSSCAGDAQTVLTMIHNTPFGDIVDTEDDLQPYAWKSLRTLESVYRLLGCVIGTLEINKEGLRARAEASFATVTELADTLVRTESLSFRTAHTIVSRVVKEAVSRGLSASGLELEALNRAAGEIIGRDLALDEEELRRSLDPSWFVAIRRLHGGPNPEEVLRALQHQRFRQESDEAWLQERREAIRTARQYVDTTIARWGVPQNQS